MTRRQFDEAVALLREGLGPDPESDVQGRVFVAAGYVIEHRRGIADEAQRDFTPADVAAFLAGLDGVQRGRLKLIAETILPMGVVPIH